MFRANVILAVTKRNFASYFSSVLGYLFIVVFCVAASVMAFTDSQFFAANQANLDQLSQWYPMLLLFLIPAIAMTTWSDEKKLGTDELLFTLPATEGEIMAGKYLAVLGVYTVSLLFSLINVVLLSFLGSPDIGLLVGTYFGYWLSGAALLSVGMLASSLTSNGTVAFVLGVVFCCVPVFIGKAYGVIEWALGVVGFAGPHYTLRSAIEGLSLQQQLSDFGRGVVPFSSVCYFVFLTAFALYLNMVVISKRRWATSSGVGNGLQYAVRAACLGVTFVSLLVLTNLWPARADLTAENLFSLSDATYETINGIDDDQQIVIQSFVSPDLPRDYSETRRQLLGLLREFDLRGGAKIEHRQVEVAPFSEEAEQARALGVEPVRVQFDRDGKLEESEVFLGAVIQSSTDNVEIPFFDKGIPIEYELTRSVRTVSQKDRMTVGVLQTDANVMGGMGGPAWEIVTELRKQYKVINVNPSMKILADKKSADTAADEDADADSPAENFDLLLAVMPSSLTQPQMDNFMEYVESGKPVLVFDDILPAFNAELAPRLPKPAPGGPMAGMFGQQQQRPEPKGDGGALTSLMRWLEVQWDNGTVVYERNNPHSEFSYLRPEVFFVSRSANSKAAFSSDSPVTSALQDLVCMFAGSVKGPSESKMKDGYSFIPLLQTSGESGRLEWDTFTEPGGMSFPGMPSQPVRVIPEERIRYNDDQYAHVIAAHIKNTSDDKPANVIFCSDADIISNQFFALRRQQALDIEFDNVTFVLNAVDALVGDEVYIALRSRRPAMRTLQYIENQSRELRKVLSAEEEDAEEKTEERLASATKELQKELEALRDRDDLDLNGKEQLLAQKEEQVNRKINAEQKDLEKEKNKRIRQAGLEMKRKVSQIEDRVRRMAWIAPAILPICFGLLFLGLRNLSEKQSITPERRRR